MPDRALLQAWKQADEEAKRAEAALRVQLLAYAEGKGPQPPIAVVNETKLLRDAANALLNQYIEAAAKRIGPGH